MGEGAIHGARILVVMGAAGAGKSTLAGALAHQLGWPMLEADDLHPPVNVARMAAGVALTDEDRAPWLREIATWIDARLDAGRPGVVACSALRRAYRDVLRRPETGFVMLDVPAAELERRVASRPSHFMPAALLASQLATLELPDSDERAVTVDGMRTTWAQVEAVLRQLQQT